MIINSFNKTVLFKLHKIFFKYIISCVTASLTKYVSVKMLIIRSIDYCDIMSNINLKAPIMNIQSHYRYRVAR